MTNATLQHPEVWYRQFWPWFLISIPLSSVVAGFFMMYLALHTNNSLVVDDYYKQGKEINKRIERDRMATALGLAASVSADPEGILVQMSVAVPMIENQNNISRFTLPDSLRLKWVHATQASRDSEATLQSIGGDRYLAPGQALPVEGVWRLHLDDPYDNSWRLISDRVRLDKRSNIVVSAALQESNSNGSSLQ